MSPDNKGCFATRLTGSAKNLHFKVKFISKRTSVSRISAITTKLHNSAIEQ
jgi:hypothetical protein